MTASVLPPPANTARHVQTALAQVDRLIRLETNRSKHITLQSIRSELTAAITTPTGDPQ